MKFISLLFLSLIFSSCVTNTKVISYQQFVVIDTLTLPSSHFHFELFDGTPLCVEIKADTIISRSKFFLKKN